MQICLADDLLFCSPDMTPTVNNFPQQASQEMSGGMDYDENLDCFQSCNIDVNELLSRQI